MDWSDGYGRLASITDPLGAATIYTYDPMNRLTQTTDPLTGLTTFGYDANGNVLSVTDARGGPTTYTYGDMDRLATRTDAVQKSESYQYDLGGNLTGITDRKRQATAFTYDAFDRLTQVGYADNSTTAYTLDLANRITQVTDSQSGAISLTWDGLDRLTQETTPQGTVNYTYDAAGRRATMTVQGQPAVSYTYDNADRLTQIAQGTSVVSFTYDDANRRTSTTLPNGVVIAYSYDDAGQLTGIDYKQGNTLVGDLTYHYDATGRRIAVGGSFARTGLPQPLALAVYDAANRLRQWGSTALTYDDNGNLTSDGTNTYVWDTRNRLASMTGASFQYDSFERRTSKTIGGATTQFLYDGINVVQEISAATANLLGGLGIDETFTRTDPAGPRHFLTDAQGSTLALVDSAGSVQTSYSYEPFGNATSWGHSSSNTFQYTGRENDGTGLYYYRARYYDPEIGHFISEDPLGFDGGNNFYRYVENNPVNLIDPIGLSDLVVNRRNGTLTVIGSNGQVIGVYQAGNATTSPNGDPYTVGSNGPAPAGTFPVQPPVNTQGRPEYGPYFFPVGAVDAQGRPADIARMRGIGIHGGRRGPQSRTQGCIRVSDQAARDLVGINSRDPIQTLTIR